MAKTAKSPATPENIKPLKGGYLSPEYKKMTGKYIVTAWQNNTESHAPFWESLRQMAETIGAKIITCPLLYNKNAWENPENPAEIYFEKPGADYLLDSPAIINDSVFLAANTHVLPTAKNPLSGFQSVGADYPFVIIPASKTALECLPALKGKKGRILLSTGTATQKNYIDRKAGYAAETEHCFGAVIIEPNKIPRIVEFQNGGFYDYNGFDISYYGRRFSPESEDYVLTLGDIHSEKCDVSRVDSMRQIINNIKPTHLVCHDVLDFSSRNHHNIKSPFFRYYMDNQGRTVRGDIGEAYQVLSALCLDHTPSKGVYIVESNHDRALDRWLDNEDWRLDTRNAREYLTLALRKLECWEGFQAFPEAMQLFGYSAGLHFLATDSSLVINGVEFGHHGDKGINGSRGSIQGFRKLGIPLVIGHSHTPGKAGFAVQVGVGGNIDMGYNEGASSWRHAHAVTFPNGQTQLIIEA